MLRQTSRYRDNKDRLAKSRGFMSERQRQDYLARMRGFSSNAEYRKEGSRRRQSTPRNQVLSAIINRRLDELGETQSWLARRIGLSRQSVSLYALGKVLPKDDGTLRRIVFALGLKTTTATTVGLSTIRELWNVNSGENSTVRNITT